MKHQIVHALQKYVFNPPIKLLFAIGVAPPGYALHRNRDRTDFMGMGLSGFSAEETNFVSETDVIQRFSLPSISDCSIQRKL